jgi:ubiquilin
MDEERLQRMMSDPNVQQSMNEALNNPDFVNMLIDSNPMLRNMPNAREIITSPFMRQMMSNPQMMSQAMRMQRGMRGGDSSFPAPGATDTTPEDAAATENQGGAGQANANPFNPFMNPFMMPGAGAGAGAGGAGQMNIAQMLQALGGARPPQAGATTTPSANPTAGATEGATAGQTPAAGQGSQSPPPANPFAALFPPPGGDQANPFGMNPEMMQQMMQLLGGGGAAPPAPPDNRPPEVRYEEQLRQLNDMGFYDFDRNVAALRRSGGSVQGAIEHLLNSGS